MAKYKVFLIGCVAAFFVIAVPCAILTWGYINNQNSYEECMTWEDATEKECSAYLD